MPKKIRLGLIGCGGNMQRGHIPRIKKDREVEVVSVADPVESQARALMDIWGKETAYYTDFRRMIRNEELDAVFISSPHATHYGQARYSLENGLHTLVEKPLTISSSHSQTLLELARKKRRFLQVSYQRNFMAQHTYARELVRTGKIGTLRGVVSYVAQSWTRIGGWRNNPKLSGGGMFMDTGSHLVASTLWVTGLEPVEVFAFNDYAGKKVDINTVVNVKFKGGAIGTLNTFGNARVHDERIAIHGSKGVIVFHLHQWKTRSVLVNDKRMKVPARIKETTPDAALFRWMRYSGKGYEPPKFALQVAKLSEAAYRSVEQKKPVKVRR